MENKPTDSEKRLGINYSMDGTWKKEYQHWKKFTREFASKLSKANIDRISGAQAY